MTVQRIDDDHCNPKRLWKEMGSPDNLTRAEVVSIKERSKLTEEPLPFAVENGKTVVRLSLSTNDVALITAHA